MEPPPPPDCVMLVAPLMPSMNILTAVPSTSLKRISHISSMMVFSAIFLASGTLVQILLLIVSSSWKQPARIEAWAYVCKVRDVCSCTTRKVSASDFCALVMALNSARASSAALSFSRLSVSLNSKVDN